MVIGIVHNNNNRFGGIENQIVSLINVLSVQYKVCYFTEFPNSLVCKQILSNNVEIIQISGGLQNELRIISRAITSRGINILQIHTFDEGIKYRLIKIFNPRVKVIIRVHTYIACSWIPKWRKKLYYFIDSISSFLVNKFILNGEYMIKEFKQNTFISLNKTVSIIDGTKEIDRNANICFGKDYFETPNLLMIANVIPHKGHDVLIKSLGLLKKQGIIVHCSILGATDRDTTYFNYLKKLASIEMVSNQIEYLGFHTDIKKYITSSKVVVLPSDSEGTPNCIMEAMSMKRLVIVTDTGAVAEFVENGKSGFLHRPQNPNEFVSRIKEVLSFEPKQLETICSNGYEFWRNNLSIEAMTNKFLNIYKLL